MSGLGSGPRDGPVALMDGTSPLAHRTDGRAPPHADAQRPEGPHRVPATPSGPSPAGEWAPAPPGRRRIRHAPSPPDPLFRTLRERRTARRASVHLQGIAAQSGGFCSQEHRREGEHDSRHGSLRAEGPRDSISAKPSHAPVPASRRCASCRHASEGGTIGDHASGLPPGGLGTGRTRCLPRIPGRPPSLRAGPGTYAGFSFGTPKCKRSNAGTVFIAVLE